MSPEALAALLVQVGMTLEEMQALAAPLGMSVEATATLVAAIQAEVQADPESRGYAGQDAAAITALLNTPVVVQPAPQYQDVLISDVEGYMAARLLLVGIQDWIVSAEDGMPKKVARQLVQIIEGGRLRVFVTSDAARRANVLALFSTLVSVGAGGITQTHYGEIEAMTIAPSGPPEVRTPRWSVLIEGVPDAPNMAVEAIVVEALAHGA